MTKTIVSETVPEYPEFGLIWVVLSNETAYRYISGTWQYWIAEG